MEPLILVEKNKEIGWITLNRPKRHNSLIPELLEEMLAGLKTFRDTSGIRAVILRANGDSFSTGGDLRGFINHLSSQDTIKAYASNIVGLLNKVILEMIGLPVPIITAAQGITTGGSIGFLLASDIVFLTPEANITPFYSVVGFSPDGGWTTILPDIIGPSRTNEILTRNLSITPTQAVEWGLASEIIHPDNLLQKVSETALEIAAKQPKSISQIKRLRWRDHKSLKQALKMEQAFFVETILSKNVQKSLQNFWNQMTNT